MDVGPHRDLIAELANAVRTNSTLKFGLYHSLFEWFNPMYLSDKQSSFKQNTFVANKVSIRTGICFHINVKDVTACSFILGCHL